MDATTLPLPLRRQADKQLGLFTRAQAKKAGVAARELDRQRRARNLVAVRRGVYLDRVAWASSAADPASRHLLEAVARRLVTTGDVVISHQSAAAVLGYRLLDGPPRRPTLTVARPAGSPPLRLHDLYTGDLPRQDRLRRGDVEMTSGPRTVADCCRSLGRDAALVVADSALREGVPRAQVLEVLSRCRTWPGAVLAKDVVLFADGRSESVLETLARQWFLEQGLPAPEPQARLLAASGGRFLARVDFFWPEFRTVCEMDGRLKYAPEREARPGSPGDPLFEEKKREDRLREHGAEVVRGYWSDRHDRGAALADRLTQAFARGQAQPVGPRYRVLPPRPDTVGA
jgi:hypothetical protein